MDTKKKIKDLSAEELKQYHKERYQARQRSSLTITIANCPDDLREAILASINSGAK